ncbi:hypothetical protein [Streptomyces sp. NPDC092903]|uniref:hypothetical protein n=1 Tax=Streptomyces sp. NPDC092903 TaxID=3366017 RepID=UPI0037FE1276
MPSAGELREIVAGDPRGYAQRWTFGVPSWRHVSEGGFRKDRYEVVRLDEETARRFVTGHHYLSGWPDIYSCQASGLVKGIRQTQGRKAWFRSSCLPGGRTASPTPGGRTPK